MPTPTSPEIPLTYTVPSFPSLYWPINTADGRAQYLYYQSDIWRFTLYWTLIAYGAVHLATSGWAVVVLVRQVFLGTDYHAASTQRRPGVAGYVDSVRRVGEALGVGYGDRRVENASFEMTSRRHHRQRSRSRSHERVRPPSSSTSVPVSSPTRESTDQPAAVAAAAKTQKKGGSTSTSKRSKARDLRWVWLIPLVYCTIGSIEALMAGSIVGVILGASYEAGYFKMSTWTPLVWSLVNVLLLILSSFSIQGGL